MYQTIKTKIVFVSKLFVAFAIFDLVILLTSVAQVGVAGRDVYFNGFWGTQAEILIKVLTLHF